MPGGKRRDTEGELRVVSACQLSCLSWLCGLYPSFISCFPGPELQWMLDWKKQDPVVGMLITGSLSSHVHCGDIPVTWSVR